ncbi:MAG: hypothetical protein R3D03_09960 [Geminicoccaceae bacterium]
MAPGIIMARSVNAATRMADSFDVSRWAYRFICWIESLLQRK